jgi:hypothetical protein
MFAMAVFAAVICLGQAAAAKKSYTFHGKVERLMKAPRD